MLAASSARVLEQLNPDKLHQMATPSGVTVWSRYVSSASVRGMLVRLRLGCHTAAAPVPQSGWVGLCRDPSE